MTTNGVLYLGEEETMSYTTFGTVGRGDEGDKILKCYTCDFLRSVLIFIKQYSDSMCCSSIVAENYELYLIYVK